MEVSEIIQQLPYTSPFLFVDEITEISENGASGNYTFNENEFYYKGHFKEHPITPGVILTETMAQIGVVCLGIFLLKDDLGSNKTPQIALTSSAIDFFLPVFPNEKVRVVSEKIYFRFNKLKCAVKMMNHKNELVCRGTIAGMLNTK